MDWFTGTLRIWHTDDKCWAKPDFERHSLTFKEANKLIDEYPTFIAAAMYAPSAVNLVHNGQLCAL